MVKIFLVPFIGGVDTAPLGNCHGLIIWDMNVQIGSKIIFNCIVENLQYADQQVNRSKL